MTDLTVETDKIIETKFSDALSERYLAYALSTIMSRSLPDVRDGLKPVHRRLLYAMHLLKLDPDKGFKKCARVVGDVIGKYHPHGDQSVYDALVRLAQDFSVRYPLIDGQGNFGNVDGDNAAAMRYTEARLTAVAALLLQGLEDDAVDFRETYDGEEREPVVFPAGFPNILANGASGIAVGMATNIPPHNVAELCDGLMAIVDLRLGRRQYLSTTQLVNRIPGPDFPTGGVIVESHESILQSYETGRGSFRLRARWEREDLGRGGYNIIVTEIPYQVQKSRLIEKIAELITDKKLPILADVRDESAEEIRIVLEPKNRTIEDQVLMESLFKLTDLEVRISLNLNVLDKDQVPRVMNLRETLEAYLDHRLVVLIRRSEFRLAKIEHRMEVLQGYLVAYLNLDEVIRIIREEDDAKQALMKKFSLTDLQAESILNMRLRSLRKLEEIEIRSENQALTLERDSLKELLASEDMQWTVIGESLAELKTMFGPKTSLGARRTKFDDAPVSESFDASAMMEALIEKEPITVICSKLGWVRALKGHLADGEEVKFKDGDEGLFRFNSYTTEKLLLFVSNGKFYTLSADKLPGGRGHGEPIRLMADIGHNEEPVAFFPYREGERFVLASDKGKGFVVESSKLVASTKGGKQIMNLPAGARAQSCRKLDGSHIAVLGSNRKLLIFETEDLPTLSKGQGVALQKYGNDKLTDIKIFNLEDGLSWTMGGAEGRTRVETDLDMWIGRRANVGRLVPKGFPSRKTFD